MEFKNKPSSDCSLCPRLLKMRLGNRKRWPDKFNAPVASFGDIKSKLLIVGLAPGLKGANFTGRPFTGDGAGDMLYSTLLRFNLANGDYGACANDGLTLNDCRITNAVRCVPPQNKPTGQEISTCNQFLREEISSMKNLRAIIALGRIAHNATLKALNKTLKMHTFAHLSEYKIENITLLSSYHCSRYNTSTKRLTQKMFDEVFKKAMDLI